jgi:hypothetical protein
MLFGVCVCDDGGADGYSHLGVFVLELVGDGFDEVDDDVSETGGWVEKPGYKQLTGRQAGWLAQSSAARD